MAIDSAAKRKSILAINGYFLAPVIVADSSFSIFDRQTIGYGYGGIETAGVTTAGFICSKDETVANGVGTATIGAGVGSATLGRATATATIKC